MLDKDARLLFVHHVALSVCVSTPNCLLLRFSHDSGRLRFVLLLQYFPQILIVGFLKGHDLLAGALPPRGVGVEEKK
jgi:hypothetical protein